MNSHEQPKEARRSEAGEAATSSQELGVAANECSPEVVRNGCSAACNSQEQPSARSCQEQPGEQGAARRWE